MNNALLNDLRERDTKRSLELRDLEADLKFIKSYIDAPRSSATAFAALNFIRRKINLMLDEYQTARYAEEFAFDRAKVLDLYEAEAARCSVVMNT